ncbi:MAG: VOC family protein [Spirochaetales bacterium]|nr:VOC family protein [Spirochaetales bacterium]
MLVSGVHHASIVVSDMDRSLEFYRDTLGMKQEMEFWYDADPAMMDLPDSKPKQHLVLLSTGNAYLELIQYLEPAGRPNDRRTCDQGAMHICFRVEDMQKVYELLKAKGTRFHRAPDQIGENGAALANHWYVYLRGPDDEVLELIQAPTA